MWANTKKLTSGIIHSFIHLMHAIARTHTTSLMCVNKAHATLVYDIYCLGHWNEKNENVKHQTE